jgi:hypothetical protein
MLFSLRYRRISKIALAFALFAASPFLFVAGWVAVSTIQEHLSRRPFNSVQWKAVARTSSNGKIRGRMIDDLLQAHNIKGMTRAQLLALLGNDDNSKGKPTKGDLTYYLGSDRFMGMVFLEVIFDRNDRVARYQIVTD